MSNENEENKAENNNKNEETKETENLIPEETEIADTTPNETEETSLEKFSPPPTPLTRGNDETTNNKHFSISPKTRKTLTATAALLTVALLVTGTTIVTKLVENRGNFANKTIGEHILPTEKVEQMLNLENMQAQTAPQEFQDIKEQLAHPECAYIFQPVQKNIVEQTVAAYGHENQLLFTQMFSNTNNVNAAKQSFNKIVNATKTCTTISTLTTPAETFTFEPINTNIAGFESAGTKLVNLSGEEKSIYMIYVRVKNVIINTIAEINTEETPLMLAEAAANFLNNGITTENYTALNTETNINTPKNFTNGTITVGNPKNNTTEVKIALDYSCSHCKEFALTHSKRLNELQEENKITLQYQTVAFLNNYSKTALNAAACVANDNINNFEPFSLALFTAQPENGMEKLSNEKLLELTQNLTNNETVSNCIKNQEYSAWAAQQTLQKANISGTPTITINGNKFEGNWQEEGLLEQTILNS